MNLFWLNICTRWKMFLEYLSVLSRDYGNPEFRNSDLKLIWRYLFDSPYRISKRWAVDHGERDVYTYGETPLPELRKIVKQCGIHANDHVYELGCGRGRACLWLRHLVNCKVTGVECVGEFVRRTKGLEDERLTFIEGNFLDIDLLDATVIYLNGTMLSRFDIQRLATKLSSLKQGTRIITVSYPLTQYSPAGNFEVIKEFTVDFHWGEGSVYLQVVNF